MQAIDRTGNNQVLLEENMVSYTLVVDVVSANGLSGSHDSLNLCVELRFAGQRATTSVKNKDCRPVWNETFRFSALDKDKVGYGTLEAYVYNIVTAGRKSLLGRVRLSGSVVPDSSADVAAGPYPLRGGIFPRSKGTLHLKVVLENETPIATSDPLLAVIPSSFFTIGNRECATPVDAAVKEITPSFQHGMIVELMPYVFVHVVKARHLAGADARGRLDRYVEVKVGDYGGTTEYMDMEQNAEWNATFAFSKLEMDQNQLAMVYVIVKNTDMARDDSVGMVWFDVNNIPRRTPQSHEPLLPEWYPLRDESGTSTEGELLLKVWRGSQADEAFPDAFKTDSRIGPQVYHLPRLWYLRIQIIEFKCVAVAGRAKVVELDVTIAHGVQHRITKKVKKPLGHHVWNQEFMLVVAEPFEDGVQISVRAHVGPRSRHVIMGEVTIPLETCQRQVEGRHIKSQWFDLQMPRQAHDVHGGRSRDDEFAASSCHIRLTSCLEGGYHVLYDSTYFVDDYRPSAMEIPDPPTVGLLEIGILGAKGLHPRKRINGSSTLHPYCVAKYGRRWIRTRTINNSCNPVFNEQYNWDVYDTSAVLTIGVFDNAQLQGYSSEEDKSVKIGKVRIRLSDLQPGRTYAHSYPLLVLRPKGLKNMGELHLAVRFSGESILKMVRMYSNPKLPEMHYKHPISVMQLDYLRHHALGIVAARFSRMEPPLWKEAVEYMCDVSGHMWSLRKSKANFYRIMGAFSFFFRFIKWFHGVCLWKNPATTLLVHAIFAMLVLYPQLILPAVLLYVFFITVRNYRHRPTYPPHVDTKLSYSEGAHPDELDEEFDTFPTSRSLDLVRMRYDRLRSIAGRVQTVIGDVATQIERIQALASWRDTTATAIFGLFTLVAAIVIFFTPWRVLVAIAGLYTMRPPMLRRYSVMPSFFANFFLRLPQKTDSLQ